MRYSLVCVVLFCVITLGHVRAATFTVTNTGTSDGTTGSLGWCIVQANTLAGADTINFAIGSGPKTIFLGSSLSISGGGGLTINGGSQPGFSGDPIITLQGAWGVSALIYNYEDNVTIRDLNLLGPTRDAALANYGDNCTFDNLRIGTDGSIVPTGIGNCGILMGGSSSTNNIISHCLIGYQNTGIIGTNSTDLWIYDTWIGTDITGNADYPITFDGINLTGCEGAVIGPQLGEPSNVIANCGRNGVSLDNSPTAILARNKIFDCGVMAIDHGSDGVTFNDLDDGGIPVSPQNSPQISFAKRAGNLIEVFGSLNSTPNRQISLEFFGGEENHLENSGTGKYLLGTRTVTTGVDGDAEFSFVLTVAGLPSTPNLFVSATATRLDRSHGTSEFARPIFVGDINAVTVADLDVDPAWVPSGVNSGPEYGLDPTSPDDVDIDKSPGVVQAIVRPSTGRYRIAGWTNPGIMDAPDGSQYFVRGKFYVYTSNASGAAINTVPNFRLRVENEGAVLASVNYSHALTGASAPPHEPLYGLLNNPALEAVAGPSLRPSSNPLKPSLYRVDLVPQSVPSTVGSRIGATFESYSTEDPANGTLSLTEVVLGTYVPDTRVGVADYELVHSLDDAAISMLGTPVTPGVVTTGGAFNAENDFLPGRRPALDVSGEVSSTELASVTYPPGQGILMDTLNCPDDKFGVAILNIGAAANVDKPRIQPGKLYLGLFVVGSDLPAEEEFPGQETQAGLSFQIQTAGGAVSSRLDIGGPANLMAPGSVGRVIASEALPSTQSLNPLSTFFPGLPGEGITGHFVALSSPMDADIRQDAGGALGPLAAEPGPGVDAPSFRDISLGINLMQQPTTLRLSPTVVTPWAGPNRGRLRVLVAALIAAPQVNDGGYGY